MEPEHAVPWGTPEDTLDESLCWPSTLHAETLVVQNVVSSQVDCPYCHNDEVCETNVGAILYQKLLKSPKR